MGVSRLKSDNDRWYAALAGGLRLTTLGIGAWSLLRTGPDQTAITSVALLAVVAVAATLANFVLPTYAGVPPTEAVLAALAMSTSGDAALELLPYVTAPAFSAGLLRGVLLSLATTAVSALTLATSFYPWSAAYLQQSFTWLFVAAGIGLLTGWVHLLRARAEAIEQHSYEEAAKLLEDLRRVIRPLSGGLDPRPLAEEMLNEIADSSACAGAAVFVGVDSQRDLVASWGEEPDAGWRVGDDGDAHIARVPIAHGGRPIGTLLVRTRSGLTPDDERRLLSVVNTWYPRLEAAALFLDVRELATQAERSRLAREMHDGVAQDVASLGYLADDLAAELPSEFHSHIDILRSRIRDLVTQLRLSIHDLRDEGLHATGLAASIAEAARREAQAASIRLHLRVQDGSTVLEPSVEHDLYRICQEALTNVRRHSQADNLWVSCISGGGGTLITIEDDGVGPATSNAGLGLQTMTERALRVGALLTVAVREPRGTMVRVEYRDNASGGHRP